MAFLSVTMQICDQEKYRSISIQIPSPILSIACLQSDWLRRAFIEEHATRRRSVYYSLLHHSPNQHRRAADNNRPAMRARIA